MHARRIDARIENAKENMMLHAIHHKQVNKREKEMGVGRHTKYYIFALMQEGLNECPS